MGEIDEVEIVKQCISKTYRKMGNIAKMEGNGLVLEQAGIQ